MSRITGKERRSARIAVLVARDFLHNGEILIAASDDPALRFLGGMAARAGTRVALRDCGSSMAHRFCWRPPEMWCLIALGLCSPSPVWSQGLDDVAMRHGIALAAGVAGVSDPSGTAVAAVTSVAWEFSPQFSIEGGTTWLNGGAGASGLGTLFGVRAALPIRRAAPYLSGGVGIYRAVFDGSMPLPTCYRGRIASDVAALGVRYAFNDWTYAVGAGVDVFLNRHVALRPDARVLLVRVDGRTHPIWIIGSDLAYHLEPHPVRSHAAARRVAP